MKTYTATIRIFGETPEIFQDVIAEYEFIYTGAKHIVNYLRIALPLLIKPTDLNEDIKVGIAEDLGCDPIQIELDVINNYSFI